MKNIFKTIFAGAVIFSVVFGVAGVPNVVHAASAMFNTNSQDYPTFQVANRTQDVGCRTCWSSGVSNVQSGETVSFLFYYHNTGNAAAQNTRMRLAINNQGTQARVTGYLSADGVSPVSETALVSLASGFSSLGLSFQSASWYPNHDTRNANALPNGQSGAQILEAGGVNVGTVRTGWDYQGYLVVRFLVTAQGGGGNPPPTGNDFSLSVSPQGTVTVSPGGQMTYTVSVVPGTGFTNPVTLSFVSNSGYLFGSFSQSVVNPGQSTILTVNVSGGAYNGIHNATVRGINGGIVRDASVSINVPSSGGGTPNYSYNAIRLDALVKNSCSESSGSAVPMGSDASLIRIPLRDPAGGLVDGGNTYGGTVVNVSTIGTYYAQTPVYTNTAVLNRYEFCEFFQSTATFNTNSVPETRVITAVFGSRGGASYPGQPYYPSSFPIVITLPATNVSGNSATLNGEINPNGFAMNYRFEYGTSQSSLTNISNSQFANATFATAFRVSDYVSNLLPGTQYYYRIVGQNAQGTSYGSIQSFITGGAGFYGPTYPTGNIPTVITQSASGIGSRSATLNASVNPNGTYANGWFEYGTSASALNDRTSQQGLGSGTTLVSLVATVSNLVPGTAYYVRAAAQGQNGSINYGLVVRLVTSGGTVAPPQVVVTPTVPSNGVDISCVTLTPSLDEDELRPGEEFVYTATYQNSCSFELKDATLKIVLPGQVEFISTSLPPFEKTGEGVTFKLGNIVAGSASAITVRGLVNDSARTGDTMNINATLAFSDAKSKQYSLSALLTATVSGAKSNLAAAIGAIFGNLTGEQLLNIFLVLAVLFLIYWTFFRPRPKTLGARYGVPEPPYPVNE